MNHTRTSRGTTFVMIALLGCLPALTLAQEDAGYRFINTPAELAQVVALATQEVLVTSDILRTTEVAEALREAMVRRGVMVYIMTSLENVEENASYFASLSLAGANVRLGPVAGSYLIIDRRYTVMGSLIGSLGQSPDAPPTVMIDNEGYAGQFIESFIRVFGEAEVYETRIGQ
jgi:hypothetical protein